MNELSTKLTDRANPMRIQLIGVAGSGMSGLALLLMGIGHRVHGSYPLEALATKVRTTIRTDQ